MNWLSGDSNRNIIWVSLIGAVVGIKLYGTGWFVVDPTTITSLSFGMVGPVSPFM
ncbi:MAG: hypothetical protein AAF702_31545 [Chloroflexota bacterium]